MGAVLVDQAGYFGHVAVVERVMGNGDVVVSEMNNYAYGGFNIVNQRTISAGQAGAYLYIH
jgi:surface antigen